MKGQVINQIDNIVTLEIESDYQFIEYEPVALESTMETFRDQLQGLYWCLMGWMVKPDKKTKRGRYWQLPDSDKWFKEGEGAVLATDKLYTLSRFISDWIEVDYDKEGKQTIRARSTAKNKCNQKQLTDLYDKTYSYFSASVDMTDFEKEHQEAREKLGKYY